MKNQVKQHSVMYESLQYAIGIPNRYLEFQIHMFGIPNKFLEFKIPSLEFRIVWNSKYKFGIPDILLQILNLMAVRDFRNNVHICKLIPRQRFGSFCLSLAAFDLDLIHALLSKTLYERIWG